MPATTEQRPAAKTPTAGQQAQQKAVSRLHKFAYAGSAKPTYHAPTGLSIGANFDVPHHQRLEAYKHHMGRAAKYNQSGDFPKARAHQDAAVRHWNNYRQQAHQHEIENAWGGKYVKGIEHILHPPISASTALLLAGPPIIQGLKAKAGAFAAYMAGRAGKVPTLKPAAKQAAPYHEGLRSHTQRGTGARIGANFAIPHEQRIEAYKHHMAKARGYADQGDHAKTGAHLRAAQLHWAHHSYQLGKQHEAKVAEHYAQAKQAKAMGDRQGMLKAAKMVQHHRDKGLHHSEIADNIWHGAQQGHRMDRAHGHVQEAQKLAKAGNTKAAQVHLERAHGHIRWLPHEPEGVQSRIPQAQAKAVPAKPSHGGSYGPGYQ
jgi:hypothetical protein